MMNEEFVTIEHQNQVAILKLNHGVTNAISGDLVLALDSMCLEMLTISKPLVAGIAGHAIAGGCILSLCCDYRFISEGRKLIGLNEIKLGVPVPYVADCILRKLIGHRLARDVPFRERSRRN
jgi:enoyl-CoA hydratase/carnithine racemase